MVDPGAEDPKKRLRNKRLKHAWYCLRELSGPKQKVLRAPLQQRHWRCVNAHSLDARQANLTLCILQQQLVHHRGLFAEASQCNRGASIEFLLKGLVSVFLIQSLACNLLVHELLLAQASNVRLQLRVFPLTCVLQVLDLNEVHINLLLNLCHGLEFHAQYLPVAEQVRLEAKVYVCPRLQHDPHGV